MNIFLQPLWGCQPLELETITNEMINTEGNETLLKALVVVTARPAQFQLTASLSPTSTRAQLTRMDHYSGTATCVPQEEARARPHCVCSKNK